MGISCWEYRVDMDAVDVGFRDFVDAFSGTLLPDDDAPMTRGSYRLACSRWRRKEPTERFRIRGTGDFLLVQAGIVFYSVSIWVSAYDGDIGIKFPSRVTFKGDGPAAATFRDNRSRNVFASRAWEALLFGFPDAETCPIGETQFREKT